MNWKRKVYYALNPKLRRVLRRAYFFPIDLWEGISGKRDSITPPKGKIFIGPGDFKRLGEKLKGDFIRYGGLKSDHHVLDIGCGIGRIAIPLTSYIDNNGSYDGFDIVKEGIDWCQSKISKKYPNFRFKHIDLRNDLYNLGTDKKASEFKFPYENESFDFIILTSVFTHMQPGEVDNYLMEISRVMKKGGKCFATFFIIDDASEKYLKSSADPFFKYDKGEYMLHDEKVKDANIAFRKSFIDSMLNKAKLKQHAFHPGWWAGRDRTQCVDFQDVLILSKY